MGLFDLFSAAKISKPAFKLENNEFEVLNPLNECIFYLEGEGIDCTATVKKGDLVDVGQVIGKNNNEKSIPVISTVKGTVKEISKQYNSKGEKVQAIVISDLEESSVEFEKINIDALSKEQIIEKFNLLGLRFNNGNSLAYELSKENSENVILNTTNYEPNFKHYEILKLKSNEIEMGKKIIKLVSGVDLIENSKDDTALSLDLHTLVYLGEAFLTGVPHMYEYISCFGKSVNVSKALKVKVGTTISDLLKQLNADNNDIEKVIVGGALKGNSLFTLDVAISSLEKGILLLDEKESLKPPVSPCIRCAKCLRACPKGLNPIRLMQLWDRGEKDEFIKFGGDKCVECGLCSYVCPSNIEVAHIIKTAKEYNN